MKGLGAVTQNSLEMSFNFSMASRQPLIPPLPRLPS